MTNIETSVRPVSHAENGFAALQTSDMLGSASRDHACCHRTRADECNAVSA